MGPLNYDDRAHRKYIVSKHRDAFALSPDDIGSFTGFTYPLIYTPDANSRLAYTKQYPSSVDSQRAINEWIERMYKAGVIEREPPHIEYQSASFVVHKKDGRKRMVVDIRKSNLQLGDHFVPS